jgi:hypothetical protein
VRSRGLEVANVLRATRGRARRRVGQFAEVPCRPRTRSGDKPVNVISLVENDSEQVSNEPRNEARDHRQQQSPVFRVRDFFFYLTPKIAHRFRPMDEYCTIFPV